MKMITKNPGCGPITTEVEDIDLKVLQRAVKGNIECPYVPGLNEAGVSMFSNDESLLNGMSPNIAYDINGYDQIIHGPAVFVGTNDEGESVGLTEDQAVKVRDFIKQADKALLSALGRI